MGDVLEESTRAFLRERLGSVEEVVVLCALHEQRERTWSASALGERINIAPTLIESAARALSAARLVAVTHVGPDDAFRYTPESEEVDAAVDALVRAYAEEPIAVMRALSEDALERVRAAAAQTLWSAVEIAKKRR